jgi:hemerythrin-like domain-containing protein
MAHDDFLDLLHEEHEDVKEMLEDLEQAGEEEDENKEDLFEELKVALYPHIKAEEKTFYARLKDNEEAKDDALEAIEEHHAAELIFLELDELDLEDETWDAKLKVFKEMVEHHIEDEESKVFQAARDYLSHEEMEEIKEEYESEKEGIEEGMEPGEHTPTGTRQRPDLTQATSQSRGGQSKSTRQTESAGKQPTKGARGGKSKGSTSSSQRGKSAGKKR